MADKVQALESPERPIAADRMLGAGRLAGFLHRAWRAGAVLTVSTGLFHLINLVGPGRLYLGPLLVTPFRVFFGLTWIILIAGYANRREWPRLDRADLIVAGAAIVFLLRGFFHPSTFDIVFDWVATGAGVYFLVRLGIRSRFDVKVLLISVAAVGVAQALFGLGEYLAKSNPLFNSVQVDVIGAAQQIQASSQFYRIRALVGHPGFLGAFLLGVMPLAMLVLWRRRFLLAGALAALAAALFLTFSRGSWLLGMLVPLPILAFRARYWVRRNLKWLAPAALIPLALVAFNYWDQEEVSINTPGYVIQESGLRWVGGYDGPVVAVSGESIGLQPLNKFIYFRVDKSFLNGSRDPVTVVIHYFDKGLGAIRVDYDSWNSSPGNGAYNPTAAINKTNSHQWETAAFYLKDPRFQGRENEGADFRVVDDDSIFTLDQVTVQKGRLSLPSLVVNQWLSRSASISTRENLFPFAWSVLKQHPLGVGVFNSPGTGHHAVDSLPLTWMMEFGWPGLLLILALAFLFVAEGVKVWKEPHSAAAVLYIALAVVVLHGAFLMILYDKPSLVLMAAVAAVYASIRPWRRGGAVVSVSNRDCIL